MGDFPKTTVVHLSEPVLVDGMDEPVDRIEFYAAGSVVDQSGSLHLHTTEGTVASFARNAWKMKATHRFRPTGVANTAALGTAL